MRHIIDTSISFLFPKDPETIAIEKMSEEEIIADIPSAEPMLHEKYKAIFEYRHPLAKKAIWEIKYRKNKVILQKFSKILYECIIEDMSDMISFSRQDNWLIVAVPASRESLHMRGFDQCALICKELEKLDSAHVFEFSYTGIEKIRKTEHQSKIKNRGERLKNLEEAFRADEKIFKDRNVIIIDDVYTTGATMHEIAKTLKQAGTKKVIGFALAH